MTPERKTELRRLTGTATPGPWRYCGCGKCGQVDSVADRRNIVADTHGYRDDGFPEWPLETKVANATFIAASRNAIPELLDELEALAELNEQLAEQASGAVHQAAEIDSLAAQVVLLRDCLEARMVPDETYYSYAQAKAVLADTEAAATTWLEAHDREQRLGGEKDGIQRIIDRAEKAWQRGAPYKDAGYVAKLVLADLEREARQ